MKKRISKITSILLVILLAFTAVSLAACGSDSEGSKNSEGTPQNSASDKSDPSTADDGDEEPAKPEAGAEVIDTTEEDGVKYELYSDGTLIVSGEGEADHREKSWRNKIKKVIAEEGITSMRFYWCEGLTEVIIPGSVKVITEGAFEDCKYLTKVSIAEGVEVIGGGAFSCCESLTKVSIPEGVMRIGAGAFSGCDNLAEIELPDSLTYVGGNAFAETALLETVDGVVYAGNVVVGYTNIQGTPAIREGTRVIADHAFEHLDSITSVTIPDSVVRIGEDAFYSCSNLAEINVPDSVYSIGELAFDGTKWFNSQPEDAVVYAGKVAYYLHPYGGVKDLVLKEGTVAIADHAFDDCSFYTVTLPAGLKWIGDEANINADKQAEIVIPDGVTHIGKYAIKWVKGESIVLPASVTYIGEDAFLSGSTIIAPKGSYAESYALKNNFLFKER